MQRTRSSGRTGRTKYELTPKSATLLATEYSGTEETTTNRVAGDTSLIQRRNPRVL